MELIVSVGAYLWVCSVVLGLFVFVFVANGDHVRIAGVL